ncbi:hypothetical protein [Agathobaculum sp. Marseille-P7918]|uniref:hypothetical protein n=1 Tax=Agathobaculum sp. Marseille-P7918 TaxID=2479843 RepID=UPI00356B61C6
MEETKQQKFVRIAEPRVTRACKAVSLLGNLAGSNYEYTEEQVDAMFGAVQKELDNARAAFSQKDKPKKFTF